VKCRTALKVLFLYFNSGYNNTADSWISSYESDTFEEDLVGLLDQLQPLYNELHTYVRSKLQEKYKDHPFPATGHIPAHLLGTCIYRRLSSKVKSAVQLQDTVTVKCRTALKVLFLYFNLCPGIMLNCLSHSCPFVRYMYLSIILTFFSLIS
jgi:hypothetical protein